MARIPPEKLGDQQIVVALEQLPGWALAEGKLHREYRFKDFVTAFGWMTGCALIAERLNHHPEWFNVWSRVVVDLSTHEARGLTALDVDLAQQMEKLAQTLGVK